MRLRSLLILLLSLLLLTACGRKKEPESPSDLSQIPPAARPGAPPLSLSLTNLGGLPVDLKQFRGRPIILHLFTTWCYPCLAEVELLKAEYEEIEAAGVLLIGIGLDLEGPKVLVPFQESFALPYPIVQGRGDILEGKTPLGKISSIPALFLIGPDGTILGYRLGAGGPGWLDQTLEKARAAPRR